jgi:hypothetical protein
MAQTTLSEQQKETVKMLLMKKHKTEEEIAHLKTLDKAGLLPPREDNVLTDFFRDKPKTEFGVRTGVPVAAEIGNAIAADKLKNLMGLPQKVEDVTSDRLGRARAAGPLAGARGPLAQDSLFSKLLRKIPPNAASKLPGTFGKIAKYGVTGATMGLEALATFFADQGAQALTGQDMDIEESKTAAKYSLGGNVAFRAGRKGFNLFRGGTPLEDLTNPPAWRGFQRTATLAREKGIRVAAPPQNVRRSVALDISYSIAKEAPLGSGTISTGRRTLDKVYHGFIENFTRQFIKVGDSESIGTQVKYLLTDATSYTQGHRARLMGELDDLADGVGLVDLSKLKKGNAVTFVDAVEMLDNASPRMTDDIIAAMKEATNSLISQGDSLLDQVLKSPQYADNAGLRAEIVKVASQAGKKPSMNKEELRAIVDAGVMFSSKNSDALQFEMITELAKKKPAEILAHMSTDPTMLRSAMRLISGQKGLADNVRAAFLGGTKSGDGLLGASSVFTENGWVLDPEKLLTNIREFRKVAGKSEFALFPETGLAGLEELAEEFVALTAVRGSKAGTMSIFLQTPAAVATLGSIPFGVPITVAVGGAGIILMGPKVAANVLTSPKWVKRLVEGVKEFGDDDLKRTQYFQKLVSQMIAAKFNVSWVTEERQKVRFQGGGSARIGGAETPF